ncbi:hypothetical protein LPB72_14725 [Hydrogenophaga crassostreae]|uniref:Flagellar hook-length control protein-like C-terminal domain-containing protein n=1 Tax=Hydrogenophaga crassostreae TaxID=1763535 RepID=A0A167HGJ6_9BURK|nr:flagellar hook-length control protein FliK [Hydrogenophaga crassostreae]AOW12219.1 hypothetical protein LPB072_04475 [Hydrogenophaga crassostreae]OAD41164.1 hypothetical protein LPB72_14725 [Hydrogenophaga crassostreae]
MTASATSSSAQAAPANGNQATRQSSSAASSSKTNQANPADLFSNLLGLISAASDDLGGEGLADGDTDPEDPNGLLLTDPSALVNPLADLIGWPGATASATSQGLPGTGTPAGKAINPTGQPGTLSADLPEGSAAKSGLPLQGMTVLAQPVAADPGLVADQKGLATGAHANPAPPAGAATQVLANPDAVSVRYGDSPDALPGAGASNPSRDGAYMAARPANWRSTTALSSPGSSAPLPNSAPTQTAAIQVAQSATTLRSPMADPSLTAPRNTLFQGERSGDTTMVDTAVSDLSVLGTPGQASKGQTASSGSGREDSLLAGAAVPETGDLDAPDEPFSLDAALAAEEEPEGTEFMTPQQLRHASVRIGEGTDEAIDIRLSMEGDAVNVAFRTDNAEVRAGLQHNAGVSLSELMQRGGIQLGGVSVGAQSQESRGQTGNPESSPTRVGASTGRNPSGQRTAGAQGTDSSPKAPVARRSDGGPALDVFA